IKTEEDKAGKKPVETIKKDISKEEIKTNLNSEELNFDIIKEEWPKVLQNIKKDNIRIYAFMIEGEVLKYENNMITIGYEDNFSFHRDAIDNSSKNKEAVKQAVSNYFNKDMSINLIMKNSFEKKSKNIETNMDDEIKRVEDFFGKEIIKII